MDRDFSTFQYLLVYILVQDFNVVEPLETSLLRVIGRCSFCPSRFSSPIRNQFSPFSPSVNFHFSAKLYSCFFFFFAAFLLFPLALFRLPLSNIQHSLMHPPRLVLWMEWLSQQRQSQSQLTPSCVGPKGFSTVGAARRGVENAFRAWQSMHLLTDFSLSASAAASFPLGRLSLSGFLSLLSQSIYLYVDTYLSLWPTPPSFFIFFLQLISI